MKPIALLALALALEAGFLFTVALPPTALIKAAMGQEAPCTTQAAAAPAPAPATVQLAHR